MKISRKHSGVIITAISAAIAAASCLFASFGTGTAPAAPTVSSAVTETDFTVVLPKSPPASDIPSENGSSAKNDVSAENDSGGTDSDTIFIDLNTADEAELCRLDGIGDATAAEIIAFREEHGGFSDIGQLNDVKGIGSKKFEAIKEHVYISSAVPSRTAVIRDDPPASETSSPAAGTVNINTAGPDELITLDGIGEATARKIIAYREENGGFSSVEEIMEVKGIGSGKFEKIRNSICI